MIVLFSDYGTSASYVGEIHLKLAQTIAPGPVIDLCHNAPACDPYRSAYLLASFWPQLPKDSVILALVDPDGASAKPGCVLEAQGRFLIGPDNGLLTIIARRAGEAAWFRPPPAQGHAMFPGRDHYAPLATRLATGDRSMLTPAPPPVTGQDWPNDLAEIIAIDRFGNAISGARAITLPGPPLADGTPLPYATDYAQIDDGAAFWFENAQGLVEIAVKSGSAADRFELVVGSTLDLTDVGA